MLTLSILLLFNINDAGPNVNDVILPVGVFVNVNVLTLVPVEAALRLRVFRNELGRARSALAANPLGV